MFLCVRMCALVLEYMVCVCIFSLKARNITKRFSEKSDQQKWRVLVWDKNGRLKYDYFSVFSFIIKSKVNL